MTANLHIREMKKSDLSAVKKFTDQEIGQDYYSMSEIEDIYQRSLSGDTMCSLLLVEQSADPTERIYGVRITYPPGQWKKGKGRGLSPDKWNIPAETIAYFQSLFISSELQGQGYGKKMSLEAIKILKKVGARAIVCHSWKESPNDSSGKYLRGLGFKLIATHPEYWKDVPYQCTRCGSPCLCTAEEMMLSLEA